MPISSLLSTFTIRKNERLLMLAAMTILGCFHYLVISKFWALFAHYSQQHWNVFMRNFHMSGFDPITYSVLTDWHQGYDLLRHPLLAIAMYPLYLLNQFLWAVTDCNCCQLIVGTLLWLCSAYSFLLLHRTLSDGIGIGRTAATLLTTMFFGFAYILLSTFVPDHFGLSLFLLILTLHRASLHLRRHKRFSMREALLLFTLTAGTTLSNGVSVFLIVLITNGWPALRWRYLLTCFVLPSMLLVGLAIAMGHAASTSRHDIASPVAQQLQWVRHDVARTDVALENFFGESLQLHRKHVLGDVLTRRPVIVRYHQPLQYVAETLILLLFLCGSIAGRHERLLRAVLAVTAFNIVLHLVLGFAIDEVYIMAAHWAFAIPVATAFLFRNKSLKIKIPTAFALSVLTLYLWIYHAILLYNYLTWPLSNA